MRPQPYLDPMPVRGRISRVQPRGLPVINIGFNELPFPPSQHVAEALADAAARAQSYGSPHCDALRDALGEVNGIDPDHIVCGNGSEELLDVIARVFARAGDEILISQFGYIQFALTANRVGATLVKAPETELTTDVDALLDAVSDKTRVLFLANPNNPTGALISVEELARLARNLPPHIVLVLDLAYGEFADPAYCAQVHELVSRHENVVVTRTFSKAYGLAGVRVGWCHAQAWMIPLLYAARGMGPVNALAQAAACAALNDLDEMANRVVYITSERDRVAGVLRQMGFDVLPSQANFLLICPPDATSDSTEALVEYLFDEAGLVVNRTREAGLERFLRFSLSLAEHNNLLIDTVRKWQAHHQ